MNRFRFRRNPCLNIEIRGVGPGKECMSYTYIKPYSELKFSDDFMFGKVMEDTEVCRKVLETLLQREIGKLTAPEKQKDLKFTREGKPIRLDIFSREAVSGAMFDAEMQNLGKKRVEDLALPKRSRYYQSLIDSNELRKNAKYSELKDSNVIFICTFDPFGEGRYRYSFSETCEENKDLFLLSGTAKIFYNTKATGDDIPEAVKRLFEYINTGEPVNELTHEIEGIIEHARLNSEWGSEYMKEYVLLMDAKQEGIEEGEKRGEKRGVEIGKTQALLDIYRDGLISEMQVCERLKITPARLKELQRQLQEEYGTRV